MADITRIEFATRDCIPSRGDFSRLVGDCIGIRQPRTWMDRALRRSGEVSSPEG